MEDSDRISDNEIARDDEESVTHGEYEGSETEEVESHGRSHRHRRGHVVTTSGNEEWQKQQALHKQQREKLRPHERVGEMERAVRGFRIMSAGDGLLRGGFGKIPDTPAQNLLDQMKNLSQAMNQFNLTGDNLNVSGSFDKGYTVTRENPCEDQQANQNPM